jgi:hypothetical protein
MSYGVEFAMSAAQARGRQGRSALDGRRSEETHVVARDGISAVRDLQVSVVQRDCVDTDEDFVVARLWHLRVLDEGEDVERAGPLDAVLGMRGGNIDHGVSVDIEDARDETDARVRSSYSTVQALTRVSASDLLSSPHRNLVDNLGHLLMWRHDVIAAPFLPADVEHKLPSRFLTNVGFLAPMYTLQKA